MKTLRILCVGWKRPAARTFSTLALDYHANCDDAAIRQRVTAEVAKQRAMPADFCDADEIVARQVVRDADGEYHYEALSDEPGYEIGTAPYAW